MMLADSARTIGEAAGLIAIAGGLYGGVRITWSVFNKLNEILDTTREARGFTVQLDTIEAAVAGLTKTTAETFAQRTADFQTIAREADKRIHALQDELVEVKARYAQLEQRQSAHALEDDHRFERIESALTDIKVQIAAALATITGQNPESEPV